MREGFVPEMICAADEDVEAAEAGFQEFVAGIFPKPFFDALSQTADSEREQGRIVQHHAGQPCCRNHRIGRFDEGSEDVLPEGLPVIGRLQVVMGPVLIEYVHPGPVRLRQLLAELLEFAENAIVADTADGGYAAETDGQEVQPSGNEIALLDMTEERRVQHLQAGGFPHFPRCAQMVPVHGGVPFHDLQLLPERFLAGDFLADLDVLGGFYVDSFHNRDKVTVSLLP